MKEVQRSSACVLVLALSGVAFVQPMGFEHTIPPCMLLPFRRQRLKMNFPPYGGHIEYEDDDNDRIATGRTTSNQPNRRGQPLVPANKRHEQKKSTIQSLAEKSIQLTTKTALGTVKQSGKAAYYLVKPKYVEKEELLGLWRLDQQASLRTNNDDGIPAECSANIELTPTSVLVAGHGETTGTAATPWKFKPAQWPRAAKVEFAANAFVVGTEQLLFVYKGHVDRKLAVRSVIKIKGKIYRIVKTGWRGRNSKLVAVGTFLARRRMKLEKDDGESRDSDNEQESDWESDNEEEGKSVDAQEEEDWSNEVEFQDTEEDDEGG
jgi:hypothetical protein